MSGQLITNNIKKSLCRTIISWGLSLLEKKKKEYQLQFPYLEKLSLSNEGDILDKEKLVEFVISKPTLT